MRGIALQIIGAAALVAANPAPAGSIAVTSAVLSSTPPPSGGSSTWTLDTTIAFDSGLVPIGNATVCDPALPTFQPELQASVDLDVDFPSNVQAETKINHIGINWQPCGHPPVNVWTQPHFDIHFYYSTQAYRATVVCTSAQPAEAPPWICNPTDAKFAATPLTKNLPAGWVPDMSSAVVGSGLHYNSPTLQGDWFTNSTNSTPTPTWIVGGNDGRLAFVEPMVSLGWIAALGSYTQAVPVAEGERTLHELPYTYSVRSTAGAAAGTYVIHVSLTGLKTDADPCFPGDATATLASGGAVRIDELKAGDKIKAADASGALYYDEVSRFSYADYDKAGAFVVLETAKTSLRLTAEHRVPVGAACCSELKKAKDVAVGETLWLAAAEMAAPAVVTKVGSALGAGVHNPLMKHGGFPVVDGVVTAFESVGVVKFASLTIPLVEEACEATGTCALVEQLWSLLDGKFGSRPIIGGVAAGGLTGLVLATGLAAGALAAGARRASKAASL